MTGDERCGAILDRLAERMTLASQNQEAPEVVHALMTDLAEALDVCGRQSEAARVHQNARTLIPMFGLGEAQQQRRLNWWTRRQYSPPDHAARIAMYRAQKENDQR